MITCYYNCSLLIFQVEEEIRHKKGGKLCTYLFSVKIPLYSIKGIYLIRNRVLGIQQKPRNNLREKQQNANKV